MASLGVPEPPGPWDPHDPTIEVIRDHNRLHQATSGGASLARGGGAVTVNADGSVGITPASGKPVVQTGDNTGHLYQWFSNQAPAGWNPKTYVNSSGSVQTNAWVLISGNPHPGNVPGADLPAPSADPFMLGIVSDVDGPSFQSKAHNSANAYGYSNLDSAGHYTFSVEADGTLRWGATTRAAMDTSLSRAAAGLLQTGSLALGGARAGANVLSVAGNIRATATADAGNDARGIQLQPTPFNQTQGITALNGGGGVAGLNVQCQSTATGNNVAQLHLNSDGHIELRTGAGGVAATEKVRIDTAGNVGIGTASQFGGGAGVLGLATATTLPTTNPTGGGVLYADAGSLKWRGSSGTVTTIAPA